MSACQTILKTTLASLLLLTVYGRGVTLELMSHVIGLALFLGPAAKLPMWCSCIVGVKYTGDSKIGYSPTE